MEIPDIPNDTSHYQHDDPPESFYETYPLEAEEAVPFLPTDDRTPGYYDETVSPASYSEAGAESARQDHGATDTTATVGPFVSPNGTTFDALQTDSPAVRRIAEAGENPAIAVLRVRSSPGGELGTTSEAEAREAYTPEELREGADQAQRRPRDLMVLKLRTRSIFRQIRDEDKATRHSVSKSASTATAASGHEVVRKTVTVEGLLESFSDSMEQLRWIVDSGQGYDFEFVKTHADIERLDAPDIIGAFYGLRSTEIASQAHMTAYEAGIRILANPNRDKTAVVAAGRHMLEGIYMQSANIRQVMERPANLTPRGAPSIIRVMTKRAIDTLNSRPKDTTIAEFMQLRLPKFTWDGYTPPADLLLPKEYREQFTRRWHPSSLQDVDYLSSPAKIEAGELPFHAAFKAADAIAADGHAAAAYRIKTHIVEQALHREHDRFHGPGREARGEVPFLEFILPGAITGEIGLPSRGARFDYAAYLCDLFDETWQHITTEAASGQPGPGNVFLARIHEIYDGEFDEYLGLSLIQSADKGTVDAVSTLRALHENGHSWAENIVSQIAALPSRPILTNEEAGAFAASSPIPADTIPNTTTAAAAISALSADTDNELISFKSPLGEIADLPPGVQATVHVDIDPAANTVIATINYKGNDQARQVPLTLDLTSGAVELPTLDNEPLDLATAEQYQHIITAAIVSEEARRQAADAAKPRIRKNSEMWRNTSDSPVGPVSEQSTRTKTRGTADPAYDTSVEDIPASTSEDEPASPAHAVRLAGTSGDEIQALLRKQNIRGVSMDGVTRKLDYFTAKANKAGSSFGKRPQLDWAQTTIRLRQLGWSADEHDLRLFFEEGDEGQLTLVGIYQKQGLADEKRYIRGLIDSLGKRNARQARLAERSDSKAAVQPNRSRSQGGPGSRPGGGNKKRRR